MSRVTRQLIKERVAMAEYVSGLAARSRDVISSSKALLAEPVPTTFLGTPRHPFPAKPQRKPQEQGGDGLREKQAVAAVSVADSTA